MEQTLKQEYSTTTGSSYTDNLTGLYNCGFFKVSLEREINRRQRHGSPLTLALVDIDNFSQYNTKHGSLAGDCLLRDIACVISDNLRQVDLAARYSGDVYALLMIETEPSRALSIIQRIREAVDVKTESMVSLSVGLASCPVDAVDAASLMAKTEQALGQAKLKGKGDRIFHFNQAEGEIEQTPPQLLIVDDDPRKIKLLEAILKPYNYDVFRADGGHAALSIVDRVNIDLILLDIMMPEMNGYEVCRRLKSNKDTRLIPVIMVTALDDVEAKVLGIEAGADDFISMPPNPTELIARTKSLIHLKQLNDNLADIENILFSMANTVEAKDGYTHGHVERVAKLAVELGAIIGLSGKQLEALRIGGALHDIGKITIPDTILKSPRGLREEEFDVVKTHAERGWEICLPLKKNLGEALDVIRYHHEMLDGSGYPDGLKGDEIPIIAQIMAVVDIFDALTTDRPYREALTVKKACAILRKMAADGKLNSDLVEKMIILTDRQSHRNYPG